MTFSCNKRINLINDKHDKQQRIIKLGRPQKLFFYHTVEVGISSNSMSFCKSFLDGETMQIR